MKRILSITAAIFLSIFIHAQTNIPQLVSFSAIVRDAANQPLVNTPVSIRLTFKQGGQNGTLVYCALHQTTTNQNGFMSLQLNRNVLGIGCNGAPSTAFQNIPWENGGYWMEVEYQTIPGSPFINLGQLELASSFYAFSAGTAERIAGFNLNGASNGDVLTYNITTQQWEAMPPSAGFSGNYNDLTNTPNLATVATSGNYNDLTDTPNLATVATSGNYNDLTNTPNLATVATSGNYNDLTNTPNLATVATSGNYNDLTNTPTIPTVPGNVSAFNNDAGYVTTDNDQQQLAVSATGDTLKLQNGGFVIIPGISLANTPPQLATISTNVVASITSATAISGGNITSDGGANIIARGIVWSTNQNPTLANNLGATNDGTGTGSFTSNLTGLTLSTTYYVRAYATNSAGTAYGNQVSFTTATSLIVSNPGAGVTFDGYNYASIVLGNGQEWMAENLRTTTYANGDPIPNVTDNTQWRNLTTGAWVHYNNDNQYENPYGKLYNWYTVADPRNVCPIGWHVPTDAEWTILSDYLGGESVAGGKMKSTGTQYWVSPNTNATNESGFSGLPGGYRNNGDGAFFNIGFSVTWWSSTENDFLFARDRYIYSDGYNLELGYGYKQGDGFSVRCIKD